MKKIKNLIFSISTLLIIASLSAKYSLQKNSEEIKSLSKGKILFETDNSISPPPTNTKSTTETQNHNDTSEIGLNDDDYNSSYEIIEDDRIRVALTFDDGPSQYTEELIKLLDKYNIKSTFFVVGCNCKKYPDALSAIVDSGHEIAIHGYTHTSFTDLNINQVNEEISNTINYINSLGIDASPLVRPPYGNLNSDLQQNIEYPFIKWSIDTEDWKTKNKELIAKEIEKVEDGSIVLMHDTIAVHEVDMEVLEELLPGLIEKYCFVTISELAEYNNQVLINGEIYRKIKSH